MNVLEDLLSYIAHVCKVPRKEINAQTRIYDSGIISSLRLIEMMSHLEKRYAIIINPEELIEDNFRDVQSILDFVLSKRGTQEKE